MFHAVLHQNLRHSAQNRAGEHQDDALPSRSGIGLRRRNGCGAQAWESLRRISDQHISLFVTILEVDQENVLVTDEERSEPSEPRRPEPQRGFIAEWTITILLLLFGTTNLVQ